MDLSDTWSQAFDDHVAWTSDEPLKLVVESASGPFLHLANGKQLIDLISGIAVSSLGHRHKRVVAAVKEQVDKHLHVMVYGEMVQGPQVALAELLAAQLPATLSKVYFTMTGTEANEGALKLAKKYTGRTKIIAFERSYHGDTHGSLSVTGRRVYQDPFRPLLPNVHFLPFGDISALKAIDEQTACVITEPIQGEGGVRVPSKEWMHQVRHHCSSTGALLIFDEIQTGFGRTGKLFAFEEFGVRPDILTLAKAMGGGMPLGAFISSPAIMDSLRRNPPLSHVTTFGGHPVSCAAALAALEVLLEECLPERALLIEQQIRSRLRHRQISEVRGMGAMLGMVLDRALNASAFVRECINRGVLVGWTLHSRRLIRIAPPLNIPEAVLDEALDIILYALDLADPERSACRGR